MSESGSGMKKLLLGIGGAAAVGAAVYFLLKEDAPSRSTSSKGGSLTKEMSKGQSHTKAADMTKEQVLQVLNEIIAAQEQMKGYMKDLTKGLLSDKLSFEQTYDRVKNVQPSDPLERHGLSMMDFDQLLDKHASDPAVRETISRIMGAPRPDSIMSEKVQSITEKKILDVHSFMLEELEALAKYVSELKNKDQFDVKTVTIAAQAIVGSKVEQKFGITSEDIESAVLMCHSVLAHDADFAKINVQIQHTMGKLMGHPH